MKKKVETIFLILVYLPACLLISGCGGLEEEPLAVPLVRLLPGSPGYEGNGMVYGLLNGTYLVKHQKKETRQEKNPEGEVRIWHEEDWYAVGFGGSIVKIASSINEIPVSAGSLPLTDSSHPTHGSSTFYNDRYNTFAVNVIAGLANGETYGLYRYAELSNGDSIGRRNGQLQTENVNAIANLKGLSVGQSINLFDAGSSIGTSGLFNNNNQLLVLVGTGLYWTKSPQSLIGNTASNPTIQINGLDYDIVIEKLIASEGDVSVAAIETDGQQYFILSGSSDFTGFIRIKAKD